MKQSQSRRKAPAGRTHHNPDLTPIRRRAAQRSPQIKSDVVEAGTGATAAYFNHDFSRIPVHPDAPTMLQQQLPVSTPGDQHEQEADRVAERVMRMPDSRLQPTWPGVGDGELDQPGRKPGIFRTNRVKEVASSAAVSPLVVNEVSASSGRPLDPRARDFMEARFGHDFSHVRVHTDDEAAESARTLNARAYTLGNQIFFGGGQYASESFEGRTLLAHELAHVVQQSQSLSTRLQLQPEPQQPVALQEPPGPIGTARANAVGALRRAAAIIRHAMETVETPEAPSPDIEDLNHALARFFPGTGHDSLGDLLMRLELVAEWLPNIPVRKIPPIPPGDPHAGKHNKAIALNAPAWTTPPGPNSYIALYPAWYNEPDLQATRLLHESFHYSFLVMRGHSKKKPWTNAVAFQGFVSVLGGLPTGPLVDKQFPP